MRALTQALTDARIAILTCPFEPPKPKTKHKVDIDTVEKFEALRATEQQYFTDMVQKCKDSGKRSVATGTGPNVNPHQQATTVQPLVGRWSIAPRLSCLPSDDARRLMISHLGTFRARVQRAMEHICLARTTRMLGRGRCCPV